MTAMIKTTLTLTLATVALSLTACGHSALPTQMSQAPALVQSAQAPRQLVVKFKLNMSTAAVHEFNAKYGFRTLRVIPEINAQIVEVDSTVGLKLNQIIHYLQADPSVEYAEINGKMSAAPMPVMQVKPILN
ncbi:hypothetical protein COW20_19225 [bacterium (Candidatus Blackallbacteria) CG13_big_fil_rev_8_21_14_2_50_49_14]|nr:MAG: hypothetical protein COW20_19225 [bacterium (Candidatus Blackallbacteria) CG13_big_fil_rev_8_21_14_2_50_49_14]